MEEEALAGTGECLFRRLDYELKNELVPSDPSFYAVLARMTSLDKQIRGEHDGTSDWSWNDESDEA